MKIINEKPGIQLIICAGMKRSGSTLQYNIVKDVASKNGDLVDFGFMEPDELVTRLSQIIDDPQNAHIRYLAKVHDLPESMPANIQNKTVCFYIYRDLRDVYLSCKLKWSYPIDQFVSSMKKHLKDFAVIEKRLNFFTQKYETLYENHELASSQIASFLGITLTDEDIKSIGEKTSVEQSNKIIKQFGRVQKIQHYTNRTIRRMPRRVRMALLQIPFLGKIKKSLVPPVIYNPETQLHPDHVSKNQGRPGCYREQLNEFEIRQLEEEFNDWLTEKGYL